MRVRGGRSRPSPAVLRLLLRHMMGRSTLASWAADPFSPVPQPGVNGGRLSGGKQSQCWRRGRQQVSGGGGGCQGVNRVSAGGAGGSAGQWGKGCQGVSGVSVGGAGCQQVSGAKAVRVSAGGERVSTGQRGEGCEGVAESVLEGCQQVSGGEVVSCLAESVQNRGGWSLCQLGAGVSGSVGSMQTMGVGGFRKSVGSVQRAGGRGLRQGGAGCQWVSRRGPISGALQVEPTQNVRTQRHPCNFKHTDTPSCRHARGMISVYPYIVYPDDGWHTEIVG